LQARNGISNPDRIYAGQRLCVAGGFVPPTYNAPPGFATVTTHTLNIRTGPGLEFGVIAKARNGDSFRVNGRTWDGNWYLVTLDTVSGRQAWAFARLMRTANPQTIPVIIEASAPPPPSFVTLADDAMTYSGPPTLITVAPYEIAAGMSVEVIGRNEAADWFQVRTDMGTAWLPLDAFPDGFARYDFPVTG
jgi:SH3-like domain-containing protein